MMLSLGLLAAGIEHVYYEFALLQRLDRWWEWPLLSALVLLVLFAVVWLYRRDTRELPRGIAASLWTLRLAALLGLGLFLLEPEKRREQSVVRPSRAVLLVDTSQSMSLTDAVSTDGKPLRRIDQVAQTLQSSNLLERLQAQHELVVSAFADGDQPLPLATFPKKQTAIENLAANTKEPANRFSLSLPIAGVCAMIAFVLIAAGFMPLLRRRDPQRYLVLLATYLSLLAAGTLAWTQVKYPESVPWRLGAAAVDPPSADQAGQMENTDPTTSSSEIPAIDWQQALTANGSATRLADSILALLNQERGGPLAGIGLITDGNQNRGLPLQDALNAAREAGIPLFTVGVGSEKSPRNVRVVDIDVPPRVFPGDGFHFQVFLQGTGVSGETVKLQLSARKAGSPDGVGETLLDQHEQRMGKDGEIVPVEFELTPTDAGKTIYIIRAVPPEGDQDASDNSKSATVQVVDRKTRVLLLAGGPTREYQFLRVLCFRDKDVTVDVWLQNSTGKASQDADQVLDKFPETLEELMEYDCLAAFDPDWTKLSDEQLSNLDRWVSEGAGGMLVVAGAVHTPVWTTLSRERRGLDMVKALYPVDFYRRGFQLGKDVAGTSPIPVVLTDEGQQAKFLQLGNDSAASSQAWNRFTGIYGPYPTRGAKPGAVVYGMAEASGSDANPLIYLAGQFYGAGRVFYLGSGEIWRFRADDETYFDQFYTRLLRYLGEGRLLRDSNRGILMVDKDRCLVGDTVAVRASLMDPQFQPLQAKEVQAILSLPNGERRPLVMLAVADTIRGGTFTGQFLTPVEGDYEVELAIPNSDAAETMRREVRARIPNLEAEHPQRDDVVLTDIASRTGGHYYVSLEAALGTSSAPGWPDLMPAQDQETLIPLSPDRIFQERLMTWLMIWITGTLSTEWLIRRLSRLA